MKIVLADDSYSLNIKPGDRVYETVDMLYFDISTDVFYYGYHHSGAARTAVKWGAIQGKETGLYAALLIKWPAVRNL